MLCLEKSVNFKMGHFKNRKLSIFLDTTRKKEVSVQTVLAQLVAEKERSKYTYQVVILLVQHQWTLKFCQGSRKSNCLSSRLLQLCYPDEPDPASFSSSNQAKPNTNAIQKWKRKLIGRDWILKVSGFFGKGWKFVTLIYRAHCALK